ncbi:MAG TPA: hypothetical protein VMF29_09480 [Candidatus Edwardsbacteria bacterium]|nr:hypothetical protein [Candidatus Edwardsbacteria bacterium]
MRILHIAPFNTAGVPIAFVKAERRLGHDSRLVTFSPDPRGYEEDICLGLPLWDPSVAGVFKSLLHPGRAAAPPPRLTASAHRPPVWKPANTAVELAVRLRDRLLRPVIAQAIERHKLDQYDVYQLDGGHGFLKYDDIMPAWHAKGKKVICCYLGSDLRTRGVMPGIGECSDCNVTLEWDHLDLHPDIHHVFFPFDCSAIKVRGSEAGAKLRIGHSPTDRALKGSGAIIAAVKRLAAKLPVELVLIEDLPHSEAMAVKATCDIGVDQLGDLGYGISALEWLAMGVPVATCIAANMKQEVKDHPFVEIDGSNIDAQLEKLITDPALRKKLGTEGRQWLERNHDAVAVVRQIHQLAGIPEP